MDNILWETATWKIKGTLAGHTKTVCALAFSPDSATLASGGGDGTIILWDVANQARLGEHLSGRFARVYDLAYSPDGKMLASANNDRAVTLWDPQSHKMIGQPLLGHTAIVDSVASNDDGTKLASGGRDNRAILWGLAPQDWITTLCQRVGRNFRPSEWTQYFPEEAYRQTCPQSPAGTDALALTAKPAVPLTEVETQSTPTAEPQACGGRGTPKRYDCIAGSIRCCGNGRATTRSVSCSR